MNESGKTVFPVRTAEEEQFSRAQCRLWLGDCLRGPSLASIDPLKKERRFRSVDGGLAILAMILAAVGAWVHLRSASIWYDEAVTLLVTSGHEQLNWSLGMLQFKPSADLGKVLVELYERDVHPPLYFWTLALWRVAFGASLEVARSLSVSFTVGTLVVLFRCARNMGLKWASVPVTVYAFSSVGQRYAYDARPYAMAAFLVTLTLYLAYRKSRWAGVCGAAAGATHYFALLCVGPLLVFECAREWKSCRTWASQTAISFAACCVPLGVLLRVHLAARPQQYPGFSTPYEETCALLKNAVGGAMPTSWLPGWWLALLPGAFLAAAGCWHAYKVKKLSVSAGYVAFLCGFLILAVATDKSLVKMPTDYYLGIGAPWLALLIGYGANLISRSIPLLGLLLLAGSLTAKSMTQNTDYRKILAETRSECADCPVVVGVGYMGAIPACVLYESKGERVLLLRPSDTVDGTIRRVGNKPLFFLVPANEPATASVEHNLVQTCRSNAKDGYFEIRCGAIGSSPDVHSGADQWHSTKIASGRICANCER